MLPTLDVLRSPLRHPLALSALVAVALSTVHLLAVAPFTAGDEVVHLDYAWQVWHGHLPVFEDGLQLRPEHAWIPPVQWTSQHPPLYYLLLAPVVGPLADAGHAVGAMYVARALGAVLAGVFVLVVAWAARGMLREGSPVPTAAAFVAACAGTLAQTAGTVFNDLLAAVLATALLGFAVRVARAGLTRPLFAGLVLTATACALTRTSSLIVALVGLAGAALAGLAHRQVARTLALAGTVAVAVAAAAGWFYLRNLRLTGSVTGGNTDWALANQGRNPRPLWQVVADPVTWDRLPNLWWWGPVVPRPVGALVLLALPLLLGLLAAALPAALRRWARDDAPPWLAGFTRAPLVAVTPGPRLLRALPVAVPVAALAVAVVVQLSFATTGGGIYPRYLLPAALPLAVGVAAGLTSSLRGGATTVRTLAPAWTAVVLLDLLTWLATGRGGSPGAAMLTPPTTPVGYPAHPGPAWVVAGVAVVLTGLACAAVVRRAQPPRPSRARARR